MIKLWKRYSDWCLGRRQVSPERWAEIRAHGKGQYILYKAFSFAVLMIAFHDVVTQVFDLDHDGGFSFGFYIIQYGFTGICCGYGMWEDQEGKYKKALKSAGQKSFQTQ